MDSLRIPGQRLLHSPGPTPIPDEVLSAMHRQSMDLADARLDRIIEACEQGLLALLDAPGCDLYMYAANGHGAWEAAIANLVAPDKAVLVPGTGHFSESWAIQTEALGRKVVRVPWRPGYPIDPQAVEDALRADAAGEIAAVFVVHTDTASGVSNDLAAIRAAIDASGHPALMVVDVVASLAAAPYSMSKLPADVTIGASQKGLMLPAGLGFVAANAKADALARANPTPRFYWDWRRRKDALGYRKFCGTPPQQLLMGLEASLALLSREGMDRVFARHARLAGAVHAAVSAWREGGAIDFFCRVPAARSVSVTTIAVAEGVDPDAIRSLARERFQVAAAGGLGPLAGKAFRIGHLGDQNEATILGAIGGIEAALRTLGIPVGDGAAAAVAALSEPDQRT
ncbi:aminotransferase class V-fold PLP-dependent enzyme [Burkholderiaceae bacterium FT117]|uniref:pyridoxal-phosphate-dependent aminotransferase family protein n=1 Tax=Zeimonas sediminis TaxID=2944268 RepID=UPI002342EB5A|nr:aminotransferase class V-fold PLP-dependent enzyme [Zeimonas sediminis]MCM5571160.1 aminotransferase class V-fold PLP-dependent enzyme [Zeimonas sediminis]